MSSRRVSPCFDCSQMIDGYSDTNDIQCLGSDIIEISLDYWMYVSNHSTKVNDTTIDYTIVYSECPAGYCCRNAQGCNFILGLGGSSSNQLCASNRDPFVPLCEGARRGTTESQLARRRWPGSDTAVSPASCAAVR